MAVGKTLEINKQALAADINSMLQYGAAAAIPATGDVVAGSFYFETDTGILKQEQSGSWVGVAKHRWALNKFLKGAGVGADPTEVTLIATGTYTGNLAGARQIATGFKCSCVILGTTNLNDRVYWLIPSQTFANDQTGVLIDATAHCYLHAADGFVGDVNHGNVNTYVYRYWAISE